MATKLFIGLVCIVQILALAQASEYNHEDHNEENITAFSLSNEYLFEELETENKEHQENITITGVSLLVEILLKRTNCSDQDGVDKTMCNQCLNPQDLFTTIGANADDGLNEDQFARLSVVILNTISSHYSTCHSTLTYEQHYESLVGSQSDGALTEEKFESILDDVSSIYSADIFYKCFTAENIFEDNVSNHTTGANSDEILDVSTHVVYSLLRGYCIGEPTAVDPMSFTEELFEVYADGDVISEEGFGMILEGLDIGEISNDHDDHAEDNHCYSGENLFDIFGIDHESGLTRKDLERVCPALLQQVLLKSCKDESHEDTMPETENSQSEIWIVGMCSVAIISLTALCGIMIFPCINRGAYGYVIQLLIALAVATLSGDAILHLLPQAFGLHSHGHGGIHANEEEKDHGLISESIVWKGLAFIGAIYIFFIIERIMGMVAADNSRNHQRYHQEDFQLKDRQEYRENGHRIGLEVEEAGGIGTRISAVALMILIGDSVHNFADGLAIGVAFGLSMGAGVSTSIAIFCHELPHEFGDFAVLLNSGLKFKEALILNFLSAMAAMVGVCIGIPVGDNEETRQWIFAVVAGMFLYIALGDMMPDLLHPDESKKKWLVFLLQNIGFLIGTGIMLVIALYEDSISIDI